MESVQTSVEDASTIEYQLVNIIQNKTRLNFNVPLNGKHCINMANILCTSM